MVSFDAPSHVPIVRMAGGVDLAGYRPALSQAKSGHAQRCRVWKWVAAAFLTACLAHPFLLDAQQPGNVFVEPSEQVFDVLTAINAAGYDVGLGANTGEKTREDVRNLVDQKKIPVLPKLQRFFGQNRQPNDPGADLGQYISLALLVGPPPDFKPEVPVSDLPPDAKALADFLPLLRTFYDQAGLMDLWARAQSRFRKAVDRYSEPVRDRIMRTDAYLRFPSGAYLGRTFTIILDLLGAPEQVQARTYRSNYYLVITPSKEPKLAEIRHQYMHFLLDPLAGKYVAEIHQKSELRAIAFSAPALAADFKDDFPLLVTECLIRAAELRMDKRPAADAERSLAEMTTSGLILVRYFYDALGDFEQQGTSMMIYYKQMILAINPREEQRRLAAVKFTVPPAPPQQAPAPEVSEEQRLLDQGDNLFYRGKNNDAKAAFQSVLEKFNPKNERALYGMAVVYSNTRKPDLAEEYFLKTLETARDLRLVTWSHIYLGRLYDIKGKRDDALAQYRAASLTAAAYPEAQIAVQSGLERAFGSRPNQE